MSKAALKSRRTRGALVLARARFLLLLVVFHRKTVAALSSKRLVIIFYCEGKAKPCVIFQCIIRRRKKVAARNLIIYFLNGEVKLVKWGKLQYVFKFHSFIKLIVSFKICSNNGGRTRE